MPATTGCEAAWTFAAGQPSVEGGAGSGPGGVGGGGGVGTTGSGSGTGGIGSGMGGRLGSGAGVGTGPPGPGGVGNGGGVGTGSGTGGGVGTGRGVGGGRPGMGWLAVAITTPDTPATAVPRPFLATSETPVAPRLWLPPARRMWRTRTAESASCSAPFSNFGPRFRAGRARTIRREPCDFPIVGVRRRRKIDPSDVDDPPRDRGQAARTLTPGARSVLRASWQECQHSPMRYHLTDPLALLGSCIVIPRSC